MIQFQIYGDTPEQEVKEARELIEPKNIYDDVEQLQNQVTALYEEQARMAAVIDELSYDTGWQALPLASGISQQNASQYPCRIRKISNVVYVEGAITGFAEVTKVVATLPEGYRPSKSFYVQNVTNAGKTDTYRIYTNGNIERMATTKSPQLESDYHFLNMSFLTN